MRRIRVGIVGMGRIGGAHLDALRRVEGVEVVAIAGRTEESARRAAKDLDIPAGYGRVEDLLPVVDAVHNCTPSAAHDAVNLAAIAAGKPVYAEKPLSTSLAAARAVYRAAEAAGVVHGLNHQYRMHPAVQEMRLRARDTLGRVFFVGGRYHQQSGLYEADYTHRMAEGAQGWAFKDIGVHWVDTACCVLGRRVERVFADLRTIHPVRKEGARTIPMEVDDLCTLLCTFEGGIQGAATISKVSAGHMNDLSLTVDGQAFSMAWEQENPNRLRIGHKNRPNEDLQMAPALCHPEIRDLLPLPGGHPLGWNDALFASVREFYRAVRGEIDPSAMRCATFLDGVHGMAVLEAAMKSGRAGHWAAVEAL